MNAQYTLKDDWKPVGASEKSKKLADWMNAISKQLNRAEVVSGGTARPTDLGFRIEVDGAGDDSLFPFNCTIDSPEVTISDGRIRFADTSYTVSDPLPQTLTGATEWVYVWHEKDHSSSGYGHSATEPLSNGNRWIWPLCYYEATAGVWTLKKILHRGDINVYLPLR